MKICIVGAGYVGLISALCFKKNGHDIVCVEKDLDKLNQLKKNIAPFFEPKLQELLNEVGEQITWSNSITKSISDAEAIVICVGTPEKEDGSVDLSVFNNVIDKIIDNAQKDTVIVIKSTVPVGTASLVKETCKRSKYKFSIISNPEFLSQGTAISDTMNPERIIVGVNGDNEIKLIKEMYSGVSSPLLFMNNESAELVKYASNDFLALKLSFINEIANLCEVVGADISEVSLGMGHDSRIGNKFLKAGVGYGGSCFPKDTKATHWLASVHGHELKTIKATIEVNEQQKMVLLNKARKHIKSFKNVKVAILGATFKPNTDDLREAPAINNISQLLAEGAKVHVFDPIANKQVKALFPDVICEDSIEEAIANADICFIFTEWNEIMQFDVKKYVTLMKTPLVLDGRNCYDVKTMKQNQIIYESIGRV